MKTSRREIIGALIGAAVGTTIPLALHFFVARTGEAELMGMPLAVFGLPGFFIGGILGAHLSRQYR